MGARPGEARIMQALYREHRGLTFTELKETTGLSSPSLSLYLKSLRDRAIIRKNNQTKKYELSEAYVPLEILEGWGRRRDMSVALKALFPGALDIGLKISQVSHKEKKEELYEKYLEFYYKLIGYAVLVLVHDTIELQKISKPKQVDQYLDELPDTISLFKDFFFDYFLPLMNSLAIVSADLWSENQIWEKVVIKQAGQELDAAFDDLYSDEHLDFVIRGRRKEEED